MMGYGWAGIFRKFLVDSPYMWWPSNLVQVSLFRFLPISTTIKTTNLNIKMDLINVFELIMCMIYKPHKLLASSRYVLEIPSLICKMYLGQCMMMRSGQREG